MKLNLDCFFKWNYRGFGLGKVVIQIIKSILKLCIATLLCSVRLSLVAQSSLPPPNILNNSFANRTAIASPFLFQTNYFIVSGTLSNATFEAGEPLIDGVSSGQTVWGMWQAPANGIVNLSVINLSVTTFPVHAATFSPLLTVYTGSAPINSGFPGSVIASNGVFTNLSLVASNNYLVCYEHARCGCHWRERNQITFHVERGHAYQLCVDSAIITDAAIVQKSVPFTLQPGNIIVYSHSWEPEFTTNVLAGGDFSLGLHFTPAPINDDFEQRTTITGRRLNFPASNAGATKQPGEPDHLGNSGGSSVWYSWTAPASGRVTLSMNEVLPYAPPDSTSGGGVIITTVGSPPPPTCGKEVDQNPPPIFYPVFAVYTGTALDSLTAANCLPASLSAFPNMVEFDAVKGQTYQIALDGNRGTTGDIPFYLALTTPPPNDNFVDRIRLRGIYAVATGYNAGATHQTSEPIFGNSSGKTVWWSWRSPVNGVVSIDLSGSDYPFPLAVRTGSALGGLNLVAGGEGGASFDAVAGTTYQMAVGDSSGLTGNVQLTLQAPIVELNLIRTQKVQASARLIYSAAPGQKILLQRSTDGSRWQDVRTTVAERNTVQFTVRPAPTVTGQSYRAIILDW